MAAGLWFFALLGYFGLSSWLALLLQAKGFTIVKSVGFVTLITIGGIPGFAAAAWCLEAVGRKPTTALFLLASAVAAYVYGAMSAPTALFVAGFVMQFFLFGMWSCLYAYTPELYPTRARATGAGFASACGRVGRHRRPDHRRHARDADRPARRLRARCRQLRARRRAGDGDGRRDPAGGRWRRSRDRLVRGFGTRLRRSSP